MVDFRARGRSGILARNWGLAEVIVRMSRERSASSVMARARTAARSV